MRTKKLIFLFFNQNICCWYSKEPSQCDSSFEHPKHMLKLMDKKIFTIFRSKILWFLNLCNLFNKFPARVMWFWHSMNKINRVFLEGQNPAFWCIFNQNDSQKINQCILDDPIKISSPMGDDRSPGSQHNVWRYRN